MKLTENLINIHLSNLLMKNLARELIQEYYMYC